MGGFSSPGGAVGPTGPQGPAGADGADGADGAAGPQGSAGSANISGTAGTLVKFAAGAPSTTGADSQISDDGTTVTVGNAAGKILDFVRTALGATKAAGVKIRNTTASIVGATVQVAPSIEWEAHARVSGADRTMKFRLSLVPRTSGNLDFILERDTGDGSGYSTAFYYTTSSPDQNVSGIASARFLATFSEGFLFDADGSGLTRGGGSGFELRLTQDGDDILALQSAGISPTEPFRIHANGETKGSTKVLAAFYDGTGTGTVRLQLMGDGSFRLIRWQVLVDTSTTLNVTAADTGKLITTSNGSAITVNLPAGSVGLFFRFKNKGLGTATLTPDGSEKLFTTTQVGTLAMITGDAKTIAWDGTDWAVL